MSKTKFEYFHNHGDEDGNNSLTICFGDSNEPDHIIIACDDTEEDAIEAVKRLNTILDEYASQVLSEYKEKLKAGIQAELDYYNSIELTDQGKGKRLGLQKAFDLI